MLTDTLWLTVHLTTVYNYYCEYLAPISGVLVNVLHLPRGFQPAKHIQCINIFSSFEIDNICCTFLNGNAHWFKEFVGIIIRLECRT